MKVYNYVVTAIGIMLLLEMAGIQTGMSAILNVFGLGTNSANIQESLFYSQIGIILSVTTVASIAISFFTRSSPENYILRPLVTGILVLFVATFANIMNYALANYPAWIYSIVLLIFAPITIGYILALFEWFRGTD